MQRSFYEVDSIEAPWNSGFLDDRNVHRLQHLFDDRNLLTESKSNGNLT